VGLMYKGRLIEVDPPSKMREAWAPYSFAIEGADRRAARQALHGKPFILGAEPAGAELHVYIEPSLGSAAEAERALHEADSLAPRCGRSTLRWRTSSLR